MASSPSGLYLLAFITGLGKQTGVTPGHPLMSIRRYVTEFYAGIHLNDLGKYKKKQS